MEHEGSPFGWAKEDIGPQEGALKSSVAPGSADMTETEAGRWGIVIELEITYEDEDVCEETVWEAGNGEESVVVVAEGHL